METIIDKINKLRIDPLAEINEPPSFCRIGKTPTFTSGNFSLINGKKKAGKTFLLGCIISSVLNNSTQLDVIEGCLPVDKNVVLYFDTEQSQYHACRSVKRMCKLIGIPNPANLHAFGLRPLSPEERLKYIEEIIDNIPNVGLIAIDGIRDLLTIGINNEQEATALTSLFLKWSYDYELHIITLLHQNKSDINPRGHIGTEVVNKAESVISVTKDEKSRIFKVVCEESRDIPFDDFGFTINDDGLPVSCDIPESKKKNVTDPHHINDEKHISTIENLYKSKLSYTYDELRKAISDECNVGVSASKLFVRYFKDKDWLLCKRDGMHINYTQNPFMLQQKYCCN